MFIQVWATLNSQVKYVKTLCVPTHQHTCLFVHTHYIFFLFICHLHSMKWALQKGPYHIPRMNSLIAVKIEKKNCGNLLGMKLQCSHIFTSYMYNWACMAQNFVINCPSSWDWHFHWRMSHKCDVLFHLIVIHQENWNPFVAMEMKILEGQQVKITLYPTTK